MIRSISKTLLLFILSASHAGLALADSTTYDAYKGQLSQMQKDTKPLTNTQFITSNATNRANKESRAGMSEGGNHRTVKGTSDGGANVNSVNIGSNARMNNATIIINADHSRSTIVNPGPAKR
ncbi:hypothetical protein [Paraherbaspirillum soli]|uniref:DUF4148 domain-containing protein n=1 Tax=Paraherbaspirillum soli TaxID=631222 RepID=A0ABW0MEG1_9BURK